jgi:cell division protease FtsH
LNNLIKNLVIWLVIGLVLMTVFNQFNTRGTAQAPIPYSTFVDEVRAGEAGFRTFVVGQGAS